MAAAVTGDDSNISAVEKGKTDNDSDLIISTNPTIDLTQRLIAEFFGTYIIIFVGCSTVASDKLFDGKITFPGICVTWGLIVMATIYALQHVSAHFNPAVTVALAFLGMFPLNEVILYLASQLLGAVLASGTISLILNITPKAFFGTTPSGSTMQAIVVEIIVAFIMMFIVSGAINDRRAIKEHGGIIVGMTITLNIFAGGQISGASMNPARSLGPAMVLNNYNAIWVYIIGPIIGAIGGGFAYNLLKPTDKSLSDLIKRT
ncbi:probable aquaporin NIP4-2 [Rutidosis leptorrhynchoides]|uniref:probable aquaporin NIP4-2 n=1 Tax=Rutidosis leptorrhynchoides TaxID=125765 RepID=UPI003A9A1521